MRRFRDESTSGKAIFTVALILPQVQLLYIGMTRSFVINYIFLPPDTAIIRSLKCRLWNVNVPRKRTRGLSGARSFIVTTMSRHATRRRVDRRLLLFVLSKLHHIVSALFLHSLHNVHSGYVKNSDRFGIGFLSSRDHIPYVARVILKHNLHVTSSSLLFNRFWYQFHRHQHSVLCFMIKIIIIFFVFVNSVTLLSQP